MNLDIISDFLYEREITKVKREIQKTAEREHREFVDLMYPYFGFDKNPRYTKVIVRPILGYGAIGISSTIYLNNRSSFEERRYTNWHESSHFLHSRFNKEYEFDRPFLFEEKDGEESDSSRQVLSESIAELGALIFLDLTEGLNPNTIKKYCLHHHMNGWLNSEEINALFKIAKEDKGLLRIFVKENGIPPGLSPGP